MTLARHSLLPRSLVTMLCLTIILGLHCLMALTPALSCSSDGIPPHGDQNPRHSIMLYHVPKIAAPSLVKTALSLLVSGVAATCDPAT